MSPPTVAITFACYNQVDYTRQCVDSMVRHGQDLSRLVVVDNCSHDDTRAYLRSLPLGGLIFNQDNLGCGVAWNQGVLALQADWSIIMNNDVLVSAGWLHNLIEAAEEYQLRVISPAMIEGALDYDFDAFAANAGVKMKQALRLGVGHAVCMAVHRSVWMEIGYFQPVPKLLGYEDTMFFHELDKAGIKPGITGRSWLHHYGSVTQTAMKLERGLSQKDELGYRYNHHLLRQSWLERKLKKLARTRQLKAWRDAEVRQFGFSMHGQRENESFHWL
ncbi:glycosyltransferase [Candidatus Methylospira mobilis]|uniref:Glycosyltransferase n=1 Tax=Candidatus Methylospira mobilis TaxID=1808979 RepID=A0A5Q0BIN8_9GAMM|nr:glycosyltransferase [Candidatus Methylospira mobilis]QFY41998.1 glycosyltransferase [Candidatus Methylospira mobilis]WNV02990.1 glycosyltransferase [Candidatus Methylospira mobilis]